MSIPEHISINNGNPPNIDLTSDANNENEKKIKEYNRRIEAIIDIVSSTLTRYRGYYNEAFQYMMLIDKIFIMLDIILVMTDTMNNNDIKLNIKQKLEKVISEAKDDLTKLSNWILNLKNHNNSNNFDNSKNIDNISMHHQTEYNKKYAI